MDTGGIMDNRYIDETTQIREIVDRAMSRMNTCIPGIIDSFDPDTQTVTVRPAIKAKANIDREQTQIEYPQIVNAPLVFPFASSAGFALTLPVKKNDPCLIFFSQKAIDNWHDLGGVQPAEDGISSRHHDLTDAFVTLAPSPIPQVLGDWEENGIVIRNRAATSKVTVYDDSVVVENTTEVIIDTPKTTITGALFVQGLTTLESSVDVTGTMTNNTKDVGDTHRHSQGNDSGGSVEQDIEGVL